MPNWFPKNMCGWLGHAIMIVVIVVLAMIVMAEELGLSNEAIAAKLGVSADSGSFVAKGVWFVILGMLLARGVAELENSPSL
jgi:hypothetical protein